MNSRYKPVRIKAFYRDPEIEINAADAAPPEEHFL
jgi:hypothetical protein